VPQVASPSANIHAHGRAHARTASSARSQDNGTPTLFDSLIADSAEPAPGQGQPAAAKTDQPAGQADAAQPAAQKTVAGPAVPAKTANPITLIDAKAPAPAADPATNAAAVLSKVATAAKAAAEPVQTDTGKPDDAKNQSKGAETTGQPAAQATPAPAGTPVIAVAVAVVPTPAPAVSPQPGDKTPVAATADVSVQGVAQAADAQPAVAQTADATPSPATGPAVDTTVQGAPQAAPADPAVIAETAAQKLAPFTGKDKAEAAKPAASDGKAAAPKSSPAPTGAQGIAPQPDPQSDSVAAAQADPKAAATDKTAAKPETQPHHDRIDTGATVKADLFAPTGTDAGAGAQASASASASTTATQTSMASNASAAPQAALPQALSLSLPGLAVEIAGQAHAGLNNFQIRLDPPELGRIEVKLSVDRQGQVTSHLIADRADTFDLLRRDAPGLERALQDAGLKTAGDGLQFSLRDQSFNGQQNTGGRTNVSHVVAVDDTLPVVEGVARSYTGYAGRIGGIDIRV